MDETTASATTEPIFDPGKHLSRVSGNDYLEVKWRLVWFRKVHPNGAIFTELVDHDPGNYAVFKASVATAGGNGPQLCGGAATGYGMETKGDFGDYLEKAETKAIGRALAALGFGTQFTPDFAEARGPAPRSNVNGQDVGVRGSGNADKWDEPKSDNEQWVADGISDKQANAFFAMSMKLGDMQEERLNAYLLREYGVNSKYKLDKRQASAVYKYLSDQVAALATTP